MHILVLNWKDIKHPLAGGAEVVTHQILKNLVSFGHEVTLISSYAASLPRHEVLDNIHIIRRGTTLTVRIWAVFFYFSKLRKKVDLVIDQIHGIPFFAPLYVKKPIVAWIYEVAGPIWIKEFPLPTAFLGLLLESLYFRTYSRIPFLTHTKKTKMELTDKGVLKKNIHICSLTIDPPQRKRITKTKFPSLVYVGRLTPMKQLELFIYAANLVRYKFLQLKIFIAGRSKPEYLVKLNQLVDELELSKHVKFLGRVSEKRKYELFASSWLHIQPSIKEGFGLTILEAAASATPTICFPGSGLEEIVVPNVNGLIAKKATVIDLTQLISTLFMDDTRLHSLSQRAYEWSKDLPSWKQQARYFEKILILHKNTNDT